MRHAQPGRKEAAKASRVSLGTSSSTGLCGKITHHEPAWTEKEELADIVACSVRTDLGLDEEGSSRSYDDGGMENAGETHVSKSRRLENLRLYRQKQLANVTAKLESYEDLEAQMEHMESLIQEHFDEEPDRAMTRAE